MSGDPRHEAILDKYLGGSENVTYEGTIGEGIHKYKKSNNGYYIIYDDYLTIAEEDIPVRASKPKLQKPPKEKEEEEETKAPSVKRAKTEQQPVTRDEVQDILDRSIMKFIRHIKQLTEEHSDEMKPVLAKAFDELIANWSLSRPEEHELASSVLSKLKASSSPSLSEEDAPGFDHLDSPPSLSDGQKDAVDMKEKLQEFTAKHGLQQSENDYDGDLVSPNGHEDEEVIQNKKSSNDDDDDDEFNSLISEQVDPDDVY